MSGARRRGIARAAAAVAAGLGLVVAAGPVGAVAPATQGWWSATSVAALPAAPPSDVPADGLLVQGGLHAPTAYAALSYPDLAEAASFSLVLSVAPRTATTPNAVIEVCPLKGAFVPVQGGPIADAPAYDCAAAVDGTLDASAQRVTFDVSNLVSAGALAVAVLPKDATTRVVLSKPGAESVVVHGEAAAQPTAATVPAPPSPSPVAAPASVARSDGGPVAGPPAAPLAGGGVLGTPAIPEAVATQDAPAPVVADSAAAAATVAPAGDASAIAESATPAASGSGAVPRVLAGAVIAGLVLAVALWAFAGDGPPDRTATARSTGAIPAPGQEG